MQNEQCGLCWDLKFDNRGNQTHDLKHPHGFVPLDYCVKCRKSKFNSYGFPTHPEKKYELLVSYNKINHMFISGVKEQYLEKKRKKKIFLLTLD